jgi:hypothetical protein
MLHVVSAAKETQVSDETVEKKPGEDWNWDEIHNTWDRINSLFDHCKRVGIPIEVVSKASLFATMQVHLIENGCDAFTSKTQLLESVRLCWKYVAEHLLEVMKRLGGGVLSLEKVGEQDQEGFQQQIGLLEESLKALSPPEIDEEELGKMLEVQGTLEGIIGSLIDEHGGLSVIRVLLLLVQQYSLVATDGELHVAKAMMEDAQGPLWGLALSNIQGMLKEAGEMAKREGKLN